MVSRILLPELLKVEHLLLGAFLPWFPILLAMLP